jgi:hypothetical protein
MKVRIPSRKEIAKKIEDHPLMTYYAFLTVVVVGSYTITRKLASGYDPYDAVIEDMYHHMKAGDHLVVTVDDEKFYYAPFTPEEVAS